MNMMRNGAAAALAAAALLFSFGAPAASAAPAPRDLPACDYNHHPETHHCKIYYDDPYGVWVDELEDDFF